MRIIQQLHGRSHSISECEGFYSVDGKTAFKCVCGGIMSRDLTEIEKRFFIFIHSRV